MSSITELAKLDQAFSSLEKLSDTNWGSWKLLVKESLEFHEYWKYISTSDEPPKIDPAKSAWEKGDRAALHYLKLMLRSTDHQYLRGAGTAKEAWRQLSAQFETAGVQKEIALYRSLWSATWTEGVPLRDHLAEMRSWRDELRDDSIDFSDKHYVYALFASLPKSWSLFKQSWWGKYTREEAALIKPAIAEEAIQDEDRRRRIEEPTELANLTQAHNRGKRTFPPKKEIQCGNCKKTGHSAAQCYSKGGGAEGQGPHQIRRRKLDQERNNRDKRQEKANHVNDTYAFAFSARENDSIPADAWLIDSAASCHISNNRNMFSKITPVHTNLHGVNGIGQAKGRGEINLISQIDGREISIRLKDVVYAPQAPNCLISMSRIENTGGQALFRKGKCYIKINDTIAIIGERRRGVYPLNVKVQQQREIVQVVSSTKLTWNEAHKRLGHISLTSMKALINGKMVTGLDVDPVAPATIQCESCIQAKASHQSFPKESMTRAEKAGDLTHTDLWGPARTQSPGRAKYFITFTDDHTRRVTIKFLKLKSDADQALKNYVAWIETQLGRKPKAFRCDNGGEYIGMKPWLEEQGIECQMSAPHSPSQNGVAERQNRTLTELMRAIMMEKLLPQTLWSVAIGHAAYIRNRSPTRALNGKTPIEAWTGNKPNLSHLREFGCDVWILDEGDRAKTRPKANKFTFVGFVEGSKSIRYWNPRSHRINESRNFTFMDKIQNDESTPAPTNPIIIPFPMHVDIPIEGEKGNSNRDATEINNENTSENTERATKITSEPERDAQASDQDDPTTIYPPRELRKKRNLNYEQLHKYGKSGLDKSGNNEIIQMARDIMMGSDEIYPNTIRDARNSKEWPQWEKAAKAELDMIAEKETWDLVDLPKGRKAIGNRWVFTKKFDEKGNLTRFKARIVAQGFSQIPGQDFSETFSPVMRLDSFRTLCALAAMLNLEIAQMDIKGAYLNGNLEEEIYMRQPDGFTDGTGRVCKLKHTLYGLKQSGREWNKRLSNFLKTAGFTRLVTENCVFIRRNGADYDIIAIWVDDLFILSTSKQRKERVKTQILQEFEATDQGEPKLLLGIEINRDRNSNSIKISQERYIEKLIHRFGMKDSGSASTPLPIGVQYQPADDNDQPFEDTSLYRSAIGSLMYAAIATRPDIAYAVNSLSQFNTKPTQMHWNAVKHIFKYLQGTKNIGIKYDMNEGNASLGIVAYTDSDNGKSFHKKAITGGVILLAGGAVKWMAEKQPIITLSTMEAEYVAANTIARNTKWLRQFLMELGFRQDIPSEIFIDNQTAKKISENPELHKRSQHIDKQYHWIREQIELGIISIHWIPSAENLADIFTKSSIPKPLFTEHRQNIGMLE
jgi:Reverse transcriptase (RNA-dependent DNA polymerase)/gag-polypeptide of LTR copia-type/Integrase core domain/GAG-pre-integrase domain